MFSLCLFSSKRILHHLPDHPIQRSTPPKKNFDSPKLEYWFILLAQFINSIDKYRTFAKTGCRMGNWERQQDERREERERDKSRRENLGKFFYDLAKLTFAGLVVGGIVSLKPDTDISVDVYRVIIGSISTIIFARIGNIIFK